MFPGQQFDIIISDAEIGTWYTLYRCDGAEMVEIETKNASKSTCYFSLVDAPGTYVVGDGTSWCEGVVHAYEAIIFSPNFFSSGYLGDIELPANGGVYSGTFEAKEEIPVEVTDFYLGMLSGSLRICGVNISDLRSWDIAMIISACITGSYADLIYRTLHVLEIHSSCVKTEISRRR